MDWTQIILAAIGILGAGFGGTYLGFKLKKTEQSHKIETDMKQYTDLMTKKLNDNLMLEIQRMQDKEKEQDKLIDSLQKDNFRLHRIIAKHGIDIKETKEKVNA